MRLVGWLKEIGLGHATGSAAATMAGRQIIDVAQLLNRSKWPCSSNVTTYVQPNWFVSAAPLLIRSSSTRHTCMLVPTPRRFVSQKGVVRAPVSQLEHHCVQQNQAEHRHAGHQKGGHEGGYQHRPVPPIPVRKVVAVLRHLHEGSDVTMR